MTPAPHLGPVRVSSRIITIACPAQRRTWGGIVEHLRAEIGSAEPVRLICVDADADTMTFDVAVVETRQRPAWPSLVGDPDLTSTRPYGPRVVVSILPTGVRAEIGGFAGDATPCTNLLAAACDHLVTNPNAVTASDLYFARDNVHYVEGNLVCRFMLGQLDLGLVGRRPVSLVVERPVDEAFRINVLNAVNAMRTVGGIEVDPVVFTGRIETRSTFAEQGHASGSYGDLGALLRGLRVACADGVRPVGVVSSIEVPQSVREAYYRGEPLPNPWGSAEAILTHTATTYCPTTAAHSPLLLDYDHTMFGTLGDPRDGAELISSAFLCSMVQGLSRSPVPIPASTPAGLGEARLSAAHVRAVVMPLTTVGNIPFFAALDRRIPIILVRGNPTAGCVDPERLGIDPTHHRIHVVESYTEAAGLLLAMKEGIAPASLYRPIDQIRPIDLDGGADG